jgi:hypothetical protein
VVSACAGSGKTWLLVGRIFRLLLEGAAPSSILAITFTRKAAQEMTARLDRLLQEAAMADDDGLDRLLQERDVALPEDAAACEALRERARCLYERVLTAEPPLTLSTFQSSPLFGAGNAGLKLNPFVVIQECTDDKFRLALVYHVEGKGWIGRYIHHLPTAVPIDRFSAPTPEMLEAMSAELRVAAGTLRTLMERDARGGLPATGTKVDIGSLHFVGGRVGGLLAPTLLKVKGVDLLEDDGQIVVVRMDGDMKQAVATGGLFFGVHYIRKDQLHTFDKL